MSLPLPLCLCLSVPKPLPLPKPKHLPSSSGVWSVLKNLDLGGRTIHPRPWPRHRAPPPNRPRRLQDASKTPPDASCLPSFFRCFFGSCFCRFFMPTSLPTCLPKSTKIDEKSMPRCLPMLTSFFDRFGIDFYCQLAPPEPQKSSPRCSESTIFQRIVFRTWHRFLIDVGANLAPFCLPKSS